MHPVYRLRPAAPGALAVRGPAIDPDRAAAPARSSVLAACREAFAAALIQICQRQQAASAGAALRGLDDRTLRDIGLHRDEIDSVAAEAAGLAAPTRRSTLRSTRSRHL